VFPTMAEALGEVCALPRRLLWRGLGFCTSKSINVFLLTKGSTLFEHTTYRYPFIYEDNSFHENCSYGGNS
jgi:hypothetical protein